MGNQLNNIRRLIYTLKRRYGTPVDLYNNVVTPGNLETGDKNVTRQVYNIKRAVITPTGVTIAQVFSAAYMKTIGRDFAYGSLFDRDIKNIVVDACDLPKNVQPTPEWFAVIHGKRFAVTKVDILEEQAVYGLIVKAIVGTPTDQLLLMSQQQAIRFTQVVGVQVN